MSAEDGMEASLMGAFIAVITWGLLVLLAGTINITMWAFTEHWWSKMAQLQAVIIAGWIAIGIGIVVAIKLWWDNK